MKKFIFVLSIVALLGASSCTKNYTCTCSNTATGASSGTATVKASSAADAAVKCSNQTQSGTATCSYP